jgi:hypothetical protein
LEYIDLARLGHAATGHNRKVRTVATRYDRGHLDTVISQGVDPLQLRAQLVVAVVSGPVNAHGIAQTVSASGAKNSVLTVFDQVELTDIEVPVDERSLCQGPHAFRLPVLVLTACRSNRPESPATSQR